MMSHLPYEEEQALDSILRHHLIDTADGSLVENRRQLKKDLITFAKWIHEAELAKFDRTRRPPLLISLLSTMGIYGGEYLDEPKKESHA